MTTDVVKVLIGALAGGGSVGGLVFWLVKRYLETKLEEAEHAKKQKINRRKRRIQAEENLYHAYGRMFFWLYKAIVTGTHNGDLQAAFTALQEAEKKKKELNNEIISEIEQ